MQISRQRLLSTSWKTAAGLTAALTMGEKSAIHWQEGLVHHHDSTNAMTPTK